MATHPAVVTVAPQAPLEIHQLPTISPQAGEIRVRVDWTASTPLDMHQADGHLLVNPPQVLGDGVTGTVVEIGAEVVELKVGDKVFGFAFKTAKEKAHQIYATFSQHLVGKLPKNITPQAAVTLPNNAVTAFHTLVTDLKAPLPWPRLNEAPANAATPILIWGASSSVGQFALQILKYYGYSNLIATSSPQHHDKLRRYGAKHLFDYRDPSNVSSITTLLSSDGPHPALILDCIGSQSGSIHPISQVVATAKPKTIIAILLPIIVRSPSLTDKSIPPVYAMDVQSAAPWPKDVEVRGVRTHFWEENEFFKRELQTHIIPSLLEEGVLEPNARRVVEAPTLLERAEKALDLLRGGKLSGERAVWRVWTEDEYPEFA